ncbi:MAG: DUF2723 domain-containing protein [Armatimonadota bacterium]
MVENNKEINKGIYFKAVAFLSFLIPLIIYTLTLCPTIYAEDCAEFITCADKLGILHPPGYPIYCILGKVFTFIPVGNIAWRVNFMSAFWAALAAFFLFLLIFRLTRKIEVSFASTMLFCFSYTFWSQSVMAEVYTLNIFFLSVCLYLLQIWNENRKDKYLYLLSLLCGLSLTNHHTMLMSIPVFILFVLWCDWKLLKRLGFLTGCTALFILGLTPYLYLPIASKFNPVMDWGNPETISGIVNHITRKMYAPLGFEYFKYIGWDTKLDFVKSFFAELSGQFNALLLIIGFGGFLYLLKRNIKIWVLLFIIFIFNSFLFIFINQSQYTTIRADVFSIFYIPCYLVFACYIGYGLSYLYELVVRFSRDNRLFKICFKAIVVLLVLIPVISNYYKNDLSKNYYVHDFVKSTMDMVDEDGIIIARVDYVIFGILYFQQVENYRPDIKMYDHVGTLSGEYLGKDFLYGKMTPSELEERRRKVYTQIIAENYGRKPVYINYVFDLGQDSDYYFANYGIIYKAVKKGESLDPKTIPVDKIYLRNINDNIYEDANIEDMMSVFWDMMGHYYVSVSDLKQAKYCYERVYKYSRPGILDNAAIFFINAGDLNTALKYLNRAVSIEPDYYLAYYHKGFLYDIAGEKKEALKNYAYFYANYPFDDDNKQSARKRINEIKKELNIKN